MPKHRIMRRRVVMLGATQGMGRALARRLAEEGHTLFLLGRDASSLAATVADLRVRQRQGAVAGSLLLDLEDVQRFPAITAQLLADFPAFDTVIITAGAFETQERLETSPLDAYRILHTNAAATVALCECLRPHLLAVARRYDERAGPVRVRGQVSSSHGDKGIGGHPLSERNAQDRARETEGRSGTGRAEAVPRVAPLDEVGTSSGQGDVDWSVQPRVGTLCVFSSVAGDLPRGAVALYGASKACVTHYLLSLDRRFALRGLRVVVVKPGFVRTAMTDGLPVPPFAGSPEQVAKDLTTLLKKGAFDTRGPTVLYTPWPWRWVMWVLATLPRWVMRRLSF